MASARADEETAGGARGIRLGEPVRERLVEDRSAAVAVGQVRREAVENRGQRVVRVEARGLGDLGRGEGLECGGHNFQDLPRGGVRGVVGEVPLEEGRVQAGQAGGQSVEAGEAVAARFQAQERLLGPEEVAAAFRSQSADRFRRGDAARLETLVQAGLAEAVGEEAFDVVEVVGLVGPDLLGPQAAQAAQDVGLVPRGGDDPQPAGQAVEPGGGQEVDDRETVAHREGFVEGVDQDVAGAAGGSREFVQRVQDAFLERASRVGLAPGLAERGLDLRVVELGGVAFELAGDHAGEAPDEPTRAERLRRVGPAAVVGEHLPAGVRVDELGHDGRLADARVAGDQQGVVPVGVGPPGVDPPEQPLPAAEVPPLVVEERAEVEVGEPVVPAAIPRRLPAQVRLNGVDEPPEAEFVRLGKIPPGGQVDVVEPEDDEGGLARIRQGRDDRQLAGEPGERQLVPADALLAHGVGRQHRHHELAGPQAGLDLVVPLLAGADLAPVAPDVEAQEGKVGVEPFGERFGVRAAVAEEQPGLFRGRRGRSVMAHERRS